MKVYLVDGTYELFRHHYGAPEEAREQPGTRAATRGVLASLLYLIEQGATHIGVATDHVVESFRNDMWPTYKSSAGMPPELLEQFQVLEDALVAMGIVTWPMVELEADDALASAAVTAGAADSVEQVQIMTPDKDLGQCVVGTRIVQVDRRKQLVIDEAGVQGKFGVLPESIPDYLALVGDSSDGYPGLPGWGAKSTAAVLARYGHLEDIPANGREWDVKNLRSVDKLAATLVEARAAAELFKDLATLRTEPALFEDVDTLRWQGPTSDFDAICRDIDGSELLARAHRLAP